MALSTNYGWSEPDDTSLVKDGALAMRTLGNAIDASVWNVGFGQAGKNKIINGDFGIWQRGTSFVANGYGADRFAGQVAGTASGFTYTRQTFTPGTAPVSGYEGSYFARLTATGTNTTTRLELYQGIENVRTFAGQTVTLSFWVKGDSARTGAITPYQIFGTGGSGNFQWSVNTFSVTTSWTRVTSTFNVPSISGKTIGTNSQLLWYIGYASPNATGSPVFDIWGVQLEPGSIATPFQTASGGSIQGELAMCQRYLPSVGGAFTSDVAVGQCFSSTTGQLFVPFLVEARVQPTGIIAGTLSNYIIRVAGGGGAGATSAITYATAGTQSAAINFTVASGLVAGNATSLLLANQRLLFTGCEL